jgi:hypothetical protein
MALSRLREGGDFPAISEGYRWDRAKGSRLWPDLPCVELSPDLSARRCDEQVRARPDVSSWCHRALGEEQERHAVMADLLRRERGRQAGHADDDRDSSGARVCRRSFETPARQRSSGGFARVASRPLLVFVRGGSSPRHAAGCGYGHADLPLVQDVGHATVVSLAARHGVAVVAFVAGHVAGRRRGGYWPR